ncbi:hypothetical protein [Roseococcus sp.]|uniref:hypothetical protein n=1 Tax=Roseococcus sp. TaxID=2109646 RepID=UPI003BA9AD22
MQVASIRTTTGSLLGTIATAANTVGSVFGAATKGISMLDNYVSSALEHQAERIDADNSIFTQRLLAETAQDLTATKIEVDRFCAQSEQHHTHYKTSYDAIAKAVEDGKARRLKTANA